MDFSVRSVTERWGEFVPTITRRLAKRRWFPGWLLFIMNHGRGIELAAQQSTEINSPGKVPVVVPVPLPFVDSLLITARLFGDYDVDIGCFAWQSVPVSECL